MKPIWAVAHSLITEVLRMRFLMGFVALLLAVLTFGFAAWLYFTPGQADREVQTFLSYSLSFAWTTLSLLTIFISIATITRDIKRHEVFTVMTKPVSRGHFLLGKFLGLALFNLIALLMVGITIYGLARLLQFTQPTTDAERDKLKHLVFSARFGVKAPLPDVTAEVREKVEEIIRRELATKPAYRNDPKSVDMMRRHLMEGFEGKIHMKNLTIPPGRSTTWHFTDIHPKDKENGFLYIRFQQDATTLDTRYMISNEWTYGPEDPAVAGGTVYLSREVVDVVHEFPIPVRALSAQGDLYLTYRNASMDRRLTVIFPPEENRLELLYAVGGFEGNYVVMAALMYLRLLMIGAVGLALGAWLSFPVAVLATSVFYVVGLSTGFILYSLEWQIHEAHAAVVRAAMQFLPNYSAYDPIPKIERGRVIELGSDIFGNLTFWKDVAITGVVAFMGYLVFRFRELARVIV